ncbi:TPA: hypothetical protein VB562_001640 [Streptococcus pyogenes]|nr:hypothetical protein [Streptococcus pyogenes]HES3728491.1 hypothetical protein [Streptococcus pyogenes]HES4532280.1 hypothetical protein [Streptococcus pyogenes]
MLELSIENIIKPMKTQGKTRVTGSIGDQAIRIDLDGLVIHYNGQGLLLETIPGTYGGKRYFFLCPDCERRCRKLFKISHDFACGSCQKVHQATLNRSKTDCQYYWRLAFRECLKVDPKARHKHGYYSHDDFPKRPKYMRIAKYLYHWKRFHYYMDKGDRYWQ